MPLLSLFATAYPRWVGPVCAAHVLLMTTWILAQRVDACSTAGETLLFALVLGVVYIFSFFNAKEERTRYVGPNDTFSYNCLSMKTSIKPD